MDNTEGFLFNNTRYSTGVLTQKSSVHFIPKSVRYTKSSLSSLNELQRTYPWLLVQLRPNQNPLASCAVCQKYWFSSTRSALKNAWVQGSVDLGSSHRKSKLLLHEKSELHSKCIARSLKVSCFCGEVISIRMFRLVCISLH